MKIKEYIAQSARTDADLGINNHFHWLIGSKNEFGEFLGVIKKSLFKELNLVKMGDELGDTCFYIAKGCRLENFKMPDEYGYIKADNILEFVYQFDEYWKNKDVMGLLCVIVGICELYGLNLEEILQKNIDKLMVRHPEEFNIENTKHTKEEIDAISK